MIEAQRGLPFGNPIAHLRERITSATRELRQRAATFKNDLRTLVDHQRYRGQEEVLIRGRQLVTRVPPEEQEPTRSTAHVRGLDKAPYKGVRPFLDQWMD